MAFINNLNNSRRIHHTINHRWCSKCRPGCCSDKIFFNGYTFPEPKKSGMQGNKKMQHMLSATTATGKTAGRINSMYCHLRRNALNWRSHFSYLYDTKRTGNLLVVNSCLYWNLLYNSNCLL